MSCFSDSFLSCSSALFTLDTSKEILTREACLFLVLGGKKNLSLSYWKHENNLESKGEVVIKGPERRWIASGRKWAFLMQFNIENECKHLAWLCREMDFGGKENRERYNVHRRLYSKHCRLGAECFLPSFSWILTVCHSKQPQLYSAGLTHTELKAG